MWVLSCCRGYWEKSLDALLSMLMRADSKLCILDTHEPRWAGAWIHRCVHVCQAPLLDQGTIHTAATVPQLVVSYLRAVLSNS
jgi:hypothetical protein